MGRDFSEAFPRAAEVGKELQRLSGPTSLLKVVSVTADCSGLCPLAFEYLQGWRFRNLWHCLVIITVGKKNNNSSNLFPYILISTFCLLSFHWSSLRRTWLYLLPSHQIFMNIAKITPPHTLILSEKLNSPSFLIWFLYIKYSTLNHPCGPLLDLHQQDHPFVPLGRQELGTALQIWFYHC